MSSFQCPVYHGEVAQSLKDAPAGKSLVVAGVHADEATGRRLREMGFCESACIEKVSAGAAVICKVCGVRVALGTDLAARVMVTADTHRGERP